MPTQQQKKDFCMSKFYIGSSEYWLEKIKMAAYRPLPKSCHGMTSLLAASSWPVLSFQLHREAQKQHTLQEVHYTDNFLYTSILGNTSSDFVRLDSSNVFVKSGEVGGLICISSAKSNLTLILGLPQYISIESYSIDMKCVGLTNFFDSFAISN
ncbi:unnamed protein product, partial [Owenia fusiformis]